MESAGKSQSCSIDDNVINEIIIHILKYSCRQIADFLHSVHIVSDLICPINTDLFTVDGKGMHIEYQIPIGHSKY